MNIYSFLVSTLFTLLVFPGSKTTHLFRKISAGTFCSVITEEDQNAQLVLQIFDIEIHSSPSKQGPILSARSPSKNSTSKEWSNEASMILFLNHNPDRPEKRKSGNSFDELQLSSFQFSETNCFIFSVNFSNGNFKRVEAYAIKMLPNTFPVSEFWQSGISKKILIMLIHIDLRTDNSP